MVLKDLLAGIVDERGELAAVYHGVTQNDLGPRTDVIDHVPKDIGMKMLVRSMSPKVIAADEIGSKSDIEAIEYAICSGVKGIFTAHGNNLWDIEHNPIFSQLIEKQMIDKILFIDQNRKIHLGYEKPQNKVLEREETNAII